VYQNPKKVIIRRLPELLYAKKDAGLFLLRNKSELLHCLAGVAGTQRHPWK
jgi:hypothetical protein